MLANAAFIQICILDNIEVAKVETFNEINDIEIFCFYSKCDIMFHIFHNDQKISISMRGLRTVSYREMDNLFQEPL